MAHYIWGELPNIKLGIGSRVRIVCSGEDRIDGRGIYVPEGSSLELVGSGELYIRSESQDCYAQWKLTASSLVEG